MREGHSFHIPVMGTGFTIDTPLRVARYGIASVVSLVDDHLIEAMRRYHSKEAGEPYEPIRRQDPDSRARRITAYLDFLQRQVNRQIDAVRSASFEPDSELVRYLEWLPEDSALKLDYLRMTALPEGGEKALAQQNLRERVRPGAIDVNIMTKADSLSRKACDSEAPVDSDAMAALRGFAKSSLTSSVVFSAGLNPRLYDYATQFEDFYETQGARPRKTIILKVSDFRSAHIQAKFLAKKGLWISEYRIESGLNCGGHAFPTCGKLLGPILQEFRDNMGILVDELYGIYRDATAKSGRYASAGPLPVRLSAQGGVGTAGEHRELLRYFKVDSVGWGTPFLLVPEATCVDPVTLTRLAEAEEEDVVLSGISPLGVPFYTLRNSPSEERRLKAIEEGRPGSPCINGYLAYDTEFGEPMCAASSEYQKLKIQKIRDTEPDPAQQEMRVGQVVQKACICRHLGDGALVKYGLQEASSSSYPAVCPGPNLAYFSRIATLREMIDHIYGRGDLLDKATRRPHFFLKELGLYLNYLRSALEKAGETLSRKEAAYFEEFASGLREGIEFYRRWFFELSEEAATAKDGWLRQLESLRVDLEEMLQGRVLVPVS